eukprot:TRINITY_DN8012_c0_g1_i1.p1 TRINITY_DN8012_c0_g1~~TRINITY_DN8012_c0_g1_i1.p1  ORF type:complete len:153 (-),score=16.59 TRINITY_DN8012_c0_g1_i1:58-516(-)
MSPIKLFIFFFCSVPFFCFSEETLDCLGLGFVTESLYCSTCRNLKEFVKDEQIFSHCKKCCTEDVSSDLEQKKFVKVVLIVDSWALIAFPHVKEFVEKEQKLRRFPAFSTRYVSHSDPKLILTDTEGQVQHLSISGWKTENLEEFLSTKLER